MVKHYTRRVLLGAAATIATGAGVAAVQLAGMARVAQASLPSVTLVVATRGVEVPATAVRAAQSLLRAGRMALPGVRFQLVQLAQSPEDVAADMLRGRDGAADALYTTAAVRTLPGISTLSHNLSPALHAAGLAAGVYPSLLAFWTSQGRLLAAPLFRDPLVVYYNVDAFSRAGLAAPTGDWTLAGFMEVCRRLTAHRTPTLAHALAAAVEPFDPELFAAFVVGFGGDLAPFASTIPGLAATALTSERAIAGIRALLALHPFEPASPSPAPRDLFANGDAAIYFGHQRDLGYLATAIGDLFAWNLAPLPRFPVRPAVPVSAPGLMVVTQHADAWTGATALGLLALTPAAQQAMATTGAGVPALQALATSPTWRAAMPAVNLNVFVANPAADIVVPPAVSRLAAIRFALRASLRGVPPSLAFTQVGAAIGPPGD